MKPLARQKCLPCEGGVEPLTRADVKRYLRDLKGWIPVNGYKAIRNEFLMKDFAAAVDLVRRIAAVAEKDNHHPDMHLTRYRHLAIELYTHAIGGLSINDFILAAKIDRLPKRLKK